MKSPLRALALAFALISGVFAGPALSATFWVGSSAACTGSSVRSSLSDALLSAAFSAGSDEIRLTNTLTYSGSNGKVTLTDWDPGAAGSLTIAGGYPDCFTSPSGRTNFGNTTGAAVTVQTSSQPQSNVTLRRLNIRSADTGLSATSGASVVLDNVRIGSHSLRGILVDGGAYVDVRANSIVEANGSHPSGTGWGGGVYCNGANSEITVSGRIYNNAAHTGGNVYLANGCFGMLMGGAIIDSVSNFSGGYAYYGGGIAIDNGGELYSNGGSQLVTIRDNSAEVGAGIYVTGTGRATLINTRLVGNIATIGSAIYAIGGGTSTPQLTMDRASTCPFLISCSEIEANVAYRSIVFVQNSEVRIYRTIFDANTIFTTPDAKSIVQAQVGAEVRLGHVGFVRNTTDDVIVNISSSVVEMQHVTIARNREHLGSGSYGPARAIVTGNNSTTYLHNSILSDSTGSELLSGGAIQSNCNLVDSNPGDLPVSTYYLATPQFINPASGDFRQTSASPGVDMCHQNSLFWSSTRDIEYQTLPVNDANNDQGKPGDSGGYYDAGFDENHMNVGDDYFTLTAARSGAGSGSVVSVPLGIACGSDCSEDFFNGTLVELHALADSGSTFDGWSLNCPLPSGNTCYISVETDTTVTANFSAGPTENEIFADRFETAP